ncbi:MAG: alanyl-tRNA editing protein [Clostridia bacterium]|nr:alanyl-tRNA editing protein [Clostridia bacterium]
MSERTYAATERLFDRDPGCRAFDAAVLGCEPAGDGWDVILDRTAFFPEGGGQGADHGTLGGARVTDAHEKGGVIRHRCDAPLTPGDPVRGEIDAARRLDQSQQHTGEHILSGTICARFGCDNVGFHIGADTVTVDFNRALTDEDVALAERLANECVWRDVPVEAFVPSPEELETIAYRSKKAIDGDVRIVRIEGADTCACCGTHVPTTGCVGQIKVLSRISYKGGVRLTVVCGGRALAHANDLLAEYRAVSRLLSAKPGTLADATSRLLAERDGLAFRLEKLAQRVFARDAEAQRGEAIRVVEAEMLAPASLRKSAGSLASGARFGLVLIPGEGGSSFALCAGDGAYSAAAAAKALCERFGGRCGGSAEMAQGVLLSGDPAALRAALTEVTA